MFKEKQFLFFYFPLKIQSYAQPNTDNQYTKPLKEVLSDIQKYGVSIRYDENMVTNKIVTYAEWKYRPGIEETRIISLNL
jgi:hypothetical protein